MSNSKVRCSVCRNYFAPEEMYRTGLGGLGGVCSEECFTVYTQKYKDKRVRRRAHRDLKHEKSNNNGRRIPNNARARVRERDNERCRWCHANINVQLHHVRYRSEGGPDIAKNLISLCDNCHFRAHTNKKKYQPVLLTWLWLYYKKSKEVNVESVFRELQWYEKKPGVWVAKKHQSWVDKARSFSDELYQANVARKKGPEHEVVGARQRDHERRGVDEVEDLQEALATSQHT